MVQVPVKSICVLCGANTGSDSKYAELAKSMALLFHKMNWRLVYGGSGRGLMAEVSRELVALGGEVIGIKPTPFLKYEADGKLPEWGHNELVPDLHTQKIRMAQVSDAFLFLPGGFGTLEEFSAFRMWRKLGVHSSPVLFLNFDGYYDHLLKWFSIGKEEGFISTNAAAAYTVVNTLEELPDVIQSCTFQTDEKFNLSILAPLAAEQSPDLLRSEN
ncbi:hypothetical protein VKT23_001331 [Stygiomarasmius scandens]|uniref:Cytokinin riboside 5'-monophosphate phosphoribohydrolase n=1 Tax=Marasmiellus scandens TaxID=2682957 RepID=A0ABR1K6R2_9AGAR